jgi:hypothetical protein
LIQVLLSCSHCCPQLLILVLQATRPCSPRD